VVDVESGRIRFSHPLIASVVYRSIPFERRRELHAHLATAVLDPEERARHLALSVDGPDDSVSDALEEAARRAWSRGAPQAAAELWDRASRATPEVRSEDLRRRTHQAGLAHYECGDTAQARKVLLETVELSSEGPLRARALLDLRDGRCGRRGLAAGPRRFSTRAGGGRRRARPASLHRASPRVRLAVPGGCQSIGAAGACSAE